MAGRLGKQAQRKGNINLSAARRGAPVTTACISAGIEARLPVGWVHWCFATGSCMRLAGTAGGSKAGQCKTRT